MESKIIEKTEISKSIALWLVTNYLILAL